eukprot:g1556.t1
MSIHISRRGSVTVTPRTAAAGVPLPAQLVEEAPLAPSDLAYSRAARSRSTGEAAARVYERLSPASPSELRLSELQRKSRVLNSAMERYESRLKDLKKRADIAREVGMKSAVRTPPSPPLSAGLSPSTYRYPQSSSASRSAGGSVSPSFSEGFSRELDHERAQAITLAQTYAQEHGELLAARAELENVRKKNGYLEEQLEASKNDAVKSRQMEEDAVRSREEQRRSFQTASRALKEETERSEVLKARVKDLERDLSASLSVSAQLRRSLSDMQAEKEDAMRSSRKAQGEIDMLASTFESVQREGQTLQADIIKERRSFLEHQRATSREIESLTERLDRSYRQAAKATAKKETIQRSLDSASADLFNLRQTYKATIEQFVDLKEKYREEQRLRWTAEAEAARLRGMMPRG